MERKIKSVETCKTEISDCGQPHDSKIITQEFDTNFSLFKESIVNIEPNNLGDSGTDFIKYYSDGKLITETLNEFDKTYQINHIYYDNLELIEKKIILVDENDILDRFSELTLESENLEIPQNYYQLKEIQSKRYETNELVSTEKRFLSSEGKVVKIHYEDFQNSKNNYKTEITYEDTSCELDNNGLFISEITEKDGILHSKRNTQKHIKECESICYYNLNGFVQDIELKVVFSEQDNKIIFCVKFSRLEDDSFQVKNLNVNITNLEDNYYLHKVNLNFDYTSQCEKGIIIDRIENTYVFQMFDSSNKIFNKVESLFKKSDYCQFSYEKLINERPIVEIDEHLKFEDNFDKIRDLLPVTLEFESIVRNYTHSGRFYNYIKVPFYPRNQDFYVRIYNNHECGYYKIEYY